MSKITVSAFFVVLFLVGAGCSNTTDSAEATSEDTNAVNTEESVTNNQVIEDEKVEVIEEDAADDEEASSMEMEGEEVSTFESNGNEYSVRTLLGEDAMTVNFYDVTNAVDLGSVETNAPLGETTFSFAGDYGPYAHVLEQGHEYANSHVIDTEEGALLDIPPRASLVASEDGTYLGYRYSLLGGDGTFWLAYVSGEKVDCQITEEIVSDAEFTGDTVNYTTDSGEESSDNINEVCEL